MISETIDAPGCLTYLRHGRSAPRSCLIFSGTGHLDAALAATADHDLVDPFSTRATMLSTSFDHGGAEGDLTELNGWTSPQMLRRYAASARSARARRSYDRVMEETP
jgi:hypothetical protein